MSKRTRRPFTGQQKVKIVKRHLIDGFAVSQLCEEYQIQPTQFYLRQKQLFENGDKAFERKGHPKRSKAAEQCRHAKLESKNAQKNEVVAELLEEHVKLKKELGEL